MEQDSPDSLHMLMESILSDIFNFASLVPRVAKHTGTADYLSDVEEVRVVACTNAQHNNCGFISDCRAIGHERTDSISSHSSRESINRVQGLIQ
jgi:hypothetical protein